MEHKIKPNKNKFEKKIIIIIESVEIVRTKIIILEIS